LFLAADFVLAASAFFSAARRLILSFAALAASLNTILNGFLAATFACAVLSPLAPPHPPCAS